MMFCLEKMVAFSDFHFNEYLMLCYSSPDGKGGLFCFLIYFRFSSFSV